MDAAARDVMRALALVLLLGCAPARHRHAVLSNVGGTEPAAQLDDYRLSPERRCGLVGGWAVCSWRSCWCERMTRTFVRFVLP